jgi:hypothetical protein
LLRIVKIVTPVHEVAKERDTYGHDPDLVHEYTTDRLFEKTVMRVFELFRSDQFVVLLVLTVYREEIAQEIIDLFVDRVQ